MEKRKIFAAIVGGTTYGGATQTDPARHDFWQSRLKAAYGGEPAKCLCPSSGDKTLSIKRRRDGAERFWLARYPDTGHLHHEDCRFYGPSIKGTGLQGYVEGVIEEDEDVLRVRLAIGLSAQAPAAPSGPVSVTIDGRPRTRQRAMSLRGLLDLLLAEGSVNKWYPKMTASRNHGVVMWAIGAAAAKVVCNSVPLTDHLFLAVSPKREQHITARNLALAESAAVQGRRLVVIGLLSPKIIEEGGKWPNYLRMTEYFGGCFFNVAEAVWQSLEHSFADALSLWRNGARLFVIAEAEPRLRKKGEPGHAWHVVSLAVHAASEQYIPVESSHELRVARALVDEKRSFLKPLRYDAGSEEVFPDFELLDLGRRYPMEVFGRTDEPYRARMAEKRRYYDSRYDGSWWSWDAGGGGPLPPFPIAPPSDATP